MAWLLAILLVAGAMAADRVGWLKDNGADWHRYQGKTFKVTQVFDGDTLVIAAPDGRLPATCLQLWGIRAPRLAPVGAAEPDEPGARESVDLARQWAQGQMVQLQLEPHHLRDHDRRLLAYVILPDGTRLNERLLAAGLARRDSQVPHRWLERFALLELQAQRDKVGMWGARAGMAGVGTALP